MVDRKSRKDNIHVRLEKFFDAGRKQFGVYYLLMGDLTEVNASTSFRLVAFVHETFVVVLPNAL